MDVIAVVGAVTAIFAATMASGAERYQARAGLFDDQSAWLHVPGARRGRIYRGHLPFDDACVFQSAALPWIGQRDSCAFRRAGHAEDGRAVEQNSDDFANIFDRNVRDRGIAAAGGIFQQRRDFGRDV